MHTLVRSKPVDRESAGRIPALLQEAEKPLVIAGSGAWYADAEKELTTFVEKTGIPAFTSGAGRGVIPDTHPLSFGSSLAIRPGAALHALMSADLVLFLGSRLSLFYIFGDLFRPDAKFIQVDIAPDEIGRNRSVDVGVLSDVKAFLSELNRLVEEREVGAGLRQRFEPWVATVRKAAKDDPGPPAASPTLGTPIKDDHGDSAWTARTPASRWSKPSPP